MANINTFNCLQCRMERGMTQQKWPAVNCQNIWCSHPLCHKAVESWATHFNLQTRLWPWLWFAARSARHHDEHSAQISFPSLCILQADNSRMRGSSQSRRRPSRTFGSSQSYLSSLALQSPQSDNRTLVRGVEKDTRSLALSHANVKSGLFFTLVARIFKLYIGMIETPFRVDSLAFNGLHSSVIVESDAESYCMKMAGGAEVTEFFTKGPLHHEIMINHWSEVQVKEKQVQR